MAFKVMWNVDDVEVDPGGEKRWTCLRNEQDGRLFLESDASNNKELWKLRDMLADITKRESRRKLNVKLSSALLRSFLR